MVAKAGQWYQRTYTTILDFVESSVYFPNQRTLANIPQIISITCDNASANTAMFDELLKLLPNFKGKKAHVRCFLLDVVATELESN